MKGHKWLGLIVLILSLPRIGWGQSGPEDYTCERVRGTNPKLKLSDIQSGWDDVKRRIKSREQAVAYLQRLQEYSHQEALETGREASTWLKIALRIVGKYLTCEDRLDVVLRDIQFYQKHEELLFMGTYPWSVADLPCARDFIRSELKKKGLSRMYRGWLIVQASYFWYEEFLDSLLAVIRDLSLHPDFRRQAMQIIRPEDYADSAVLQTAVFILEHDTSYIWLGTGLSKQRVKFQPTIAMALRILAQAGRKDLIPEKYKDSLKPLNLKNQNEKLVRMTSTDTASIEVAVYFKKDALIGETTPAWFWYWRQILDDLMPIRNLEIRLEPYGSCEALGEACYRWNTTYIVLTPAVSKERIIGDYQRSGIDYMAVAIYHEKAHKDLFESVWRDLICWPDTTMPTGYACDLSQETRLQYDHDTTRVGGVLWMDDLPDQWEQSPHRVGNLTIQFNPNWPTTASFYGYVDVDGELWAMLHECLWQEGSADSLDWSWGEYSKQTRIPLGNIEDTLINVLHPSEDYERRWVFYPVEGKWKQIRYARKLPANDGIPLQALWLGQEEGTFRWKVRWGINLFEEVTDPGELKILRIPPVMPWVHDAFGKETLWIHFEPPLCLLSHTPGDGDVVPVTSPITLTFSRPMDTTSVRQGLSISWDGLTSRNASRGNLHVFLMIHLQGLGEGKQRFLKFQNPFSQLQRIQFLKGFAQLFFDLLREKILYHPLIGRFRPVVDALHPRVFPDFLHPFHLRFDEAMRMVYSSEENV